MTREELEDWMLELEAACESPDSPERAMRIAHSKRLILAERDRLAAEVLCLQESRRLERASTEEAIAVANRLAAALAATRGVMREVEGALRREAAECALGFAWADMLRRLADRLKEGAGDG